MTNKRLHHLTSAALLSAVLFACTPKSNITIKEIGHVSSTEPGYALGVSGHYATFINDSLHILGGCNFPETPAAEGGTKRYYKGGLTAPSAYGAALTYDERFVIIIGGMDEQGAKSSVLSIDLVTGSVTTLPSLPCTLDNATGTLIGDVAYIVGGNADGKPSCRLFTLNLDNMKDGWCELTPMPSRPRVQPVCATIGHKLYLWGGFCPADSIGDAHTHTDGLCYDPSSDEWTPLPDIIVDGDTLTLSGGAACAIDEYHIAATGGVNKDIFTDAISGRYRLINKSDYMLQEPAWYRFNDRLIIYDTRTSEWQCIARDPAFARAGATLTSHNGTLFYVGGELKPGIRSPKIYRIGCKDKHNRIL